MVSHEGLESTKVTRDDVSRDDASLSRDISRDGPSLETASEATSSSLQDSLGMVGTHSLDTSVDEERSKPSVLADVHVGEHIDTYAILSMLGRGAMGRVFEARHVDGGEVRALKLFDCNDPGALARFKREYRAVVGFEHPNLVALGELRVLTETRAYITMELVRGRSFVEWVRRRALPGRLPNLLRLRRAMRQLIAATAHLHRGGCIHRDLKPSNVLVTDEGRVVVLDFGLVRESIMGMPTLTREGQVLGTPAYMAPEQSGRANVGPPADWYAVGAMLFECLTGRRPHEAGTIPSLLLAKRSVPDPAKHVFGLPEPLRQLCMRLLSPDADARPSEQELIEAFSDGSGPLRLALARTPFVGRTHERDRLHAALELVRRQRVPVVVRIEARRGLGKSALLQQFFAEADARHGAELCALRSRCFERESVPYKGIDGIVDSLALCIRRMSEVEAASLQPRQIAALSRVFPLLAKVWPSPARGEGAEPKEARRLGVAALREVLARLGDRRVLVIAIDDVHWADEDSMRVLVDLLRPPDPPALLLLLGIRADANHPLDALAQPDALVGLEVESLQLGPLAPHESELLVHMLNPSLDGERIEQVLARAQGLPQIVHQLAQIDDAQLLDDTPDRMIVRGIIDLPREPRRLLELMAIASTPLSPRVIDALIDEARARRDESGEVLAGSEPAAAMLEILLDQGLLRCEAPPDGSGRVLLEVSHAHLRELIVAELTPRELARRHRELARVLERFDAEPETLADHWEQGQRPQHAVRWAELAARQAAGQLAFARAVAAYRRAIRALGDLSIEPVDELRIELVEQLIALGQLREAIELLLELAGRSKPERAALLRRRAAWLLIEDGQIDRALPLIEEQLAAVGERLPERALQTFAMQLYNRGVLRLRGLEFISRSAAELPPEQLARIDTINAFVTALSQYGHHPRALGLTSGLRARALRLALEAGEPSRIAFSLAHEGLLVAAAGDLALGDELVARALALPVDDATLTLRVRYLDAMRYFMTGRWPQASTRIDALLELAEHTPSGWLRPQLIARRAQLRLLCGRFVELRRSLPAELAAMRERGNNYNTARMIAVEVELALVDGRLVEAGERLAQFRAAWTSEFHTFETTWLDMAEINVSLFRGELERARGQMAALLAEAREHELDRVPMMRLYFDNLALRTIGQALLAGQRDELRTLEQACRRLRGAGRDMFAGAAASAQALAAELEGELELAEQAWRQALAAFEAAGMRSRVAAVQLRIPSLVPRGLAYFAREGVSGWRRFVEVFAPSVQDLPGAP